MYVDIIKEDGRLSLANLNCDCAYEHVMPDMQIYIKSGLLSEIGRVIKENMIGSNVLVIADENTYEVAGKEILRYLKDEGFRRKLCILSGSKVKPTPKRANEITQMIDCDTDFLLSVGSGVVTDLTRRAAFLSKLPFAVLGTAASMDGYTSITSSMMENGMKSSKYGESAKLLMFDPVVLATAPLIMQVAGIGDVLAKYNVLVDWKLGSIVAGEKFCPLCEQLLKTALELCSSNVDGIAARTEKGIEALIESLILAGLTVLIVKNTRSVSSIEHNISHYWEMIKPEDGRESPSHGIGVGIGFIYALLFHDMLKNTDMNSIDKSKIKEIRMSRQEKKEFILNCYPQGAAEEVFETNENWFLSWEEQQRRIDAIKDYHEQYKKDCDILPEFIDIIQIFRKLGAPTSAKQAGFDKEQLRTTLLCTKDFRTRYSIAKALDEIGLLEQSVEKVLYLEDAF